MCRWRGGWAYNEGSERMSMHNPYWRKSFVWKDTQKQVLMAEFPTRLRTIQNHCEKFQVCSLSVHSLMELLHSVVSHSLSINGGRNPWFFSYIGRAIKTLHSCSRLFHQMGGSWSRISNHDRKSKNFLLEKHHMLIWLTRNHCIW